MQTTDTEKALRRGLAYQYWSGLPRTPATERRVTESILQALNRGYPNLLTAVMIDLRTTAPDSPPDLPAPTPAIRRGSLHYGDY
ncbi:MAG: hypothetical protein ACQERE_10905 [Pseudomonadota bacterium]